MVGAGISRYGFALTREAGGSLLLVMRPRLAW